MLTPTEMQRILSEINSAFERDRRRIDKLEEEVKKLKSQRNTRKTLTDS